MIHAPHVLLVFLVLTGVVHAEPELAPAPRVVPPLPELPEVPGYVGVGKAAVVKVAPAVGQAGSGYLGIAVKADEKGRPVVEAVQPESPAAAAGVLVGDLVTHVADHPVKTPAAFREWLQARGPGDDVRFGVERNGKSFELSAKLVAASRPLKAPAQRVFLGVQLADDSDGPRVEQVSPGSPALDAGLRRNDHVLKIDGRNLADAGRLPEILADKKPGDVLKLDVRRDGKEMEIKVTLAPERGRFGGGAGVPLWKKDRFRLAVVGVEFPDIKHNPKVMPAALEELFFSRGTYTDVSATGQPVRGSLNDWLYEQSAGRFRLEGKALGWVEVGKKRGDYVQGTGTSNRTAVLVEALDKLLARDGKSALDNFDGVCFVYAGERAQGNRGSVYYPHAGVVRHQQKSRTYLLIPEGGAKLTAVGGLAKEMALALGLPDLAARPENPGSEGLGPWCALSNVAAGPMPQHLCAWAKEKLGWLEPAVIDPAVKQKLILAPVEDSPKECVKVLVRPDGSEYFLLENRAKKGFDADLPGEGLLIWRVVNGRPVLEESHGIEGPAGPRTQLAAVPYPSPANSAFTPETTPSSRSPQGGGLPVHVTNIRRLPDGRVTFQVGYEYH
jgi:M6 family metalloprotease-like protein